MSILKSRRILIGVCGSIAAYKACEVVRLLRKDGAQVRVAMTRAATQFVGPTTFAALTGRPVILDQFPPEEAGGILHVDIAEEYNAVAIVPATANILGKAAHAIADDFLSTTLNITETPVLFAPAMNFRMWRNPATQEAVSKLRAWGKQVLDPDIGQLATLDEGEGRLPDPARIVQELKALLGVKQLYKKKRILITAGPTREYIDPVRYISNRSSGKMGYALAAAGREMGAEVTLLTGPVSLAPPPGCRVVHVTTAAEMLKAVRQESAGQDYLFMAAAVADYAIPDVAAGKLGRDKGTVTLKLTATEDILKQVTPLFEGVTVAFALQSQADRTVAKTKMEGKGADFIVVNCYDEAGAGFDSETNHVWIYSRSGPELEIQKSHKRIIARKILEFIAQAGS